MNLNDDARQSIIDDLRKIHRRPIGLGEYLHSERPDSARPAGPLSERPPAPNLMQLTTTLRRLEGSPNAVPSKAEMLLMHATVIFIDAVLRRDGST